MCGTVTEFFRRDYPDLKSWTRFHPNIIELDIIHSVLLDFLQGGQFAPRYGNSVDDSHVPQQPSDFRQPQYGSADLSLLNGKYCSRSSIPSGHRR